MKDKQLLGTIALVNPGIDSTLFSGGGRIGIVTYIDQGNHHVHLKFTDQHEAVYPPASLLILKARDQIWKDASRAGSVVSLLAYKDLYKIRILLERGSATDQWYALEVARDNPDTWKNCLQGLDKKMGTGRLKGVAR